MGCSLDVGSLDNGSLLTHRSEEVNSSIKHLLNTHTLLTELVTKIKGYRETSLGISPFALTLVKGQVSQCIQYTKEESLTQIDVTGDEICFVKLATGFMYGRRSMGAKFYAL